MAGPARWVGGGKFEFGEAGEGLAPAPSPTMNMQVEPELVGNAEDYKPFSRDFLARNPSAVLKATMDIISCHTADAFCSILSILCEKYGLDLDDIVETIKAHDTWKGLQTHPLIKSLTYFNEDDVADLRAGRDMSGNVWAGMPRAATEPPAPKRRKIGVKAKASEVAAEDSKTLEAIAKLKDKLAATSITESAVATTAVAPKTVKLKLKKSTDMPTHTL